MGWEYGVIVTETAEIPQLIGQLAEALQGAGGYQTMQQAERGFVLQQENEKWPAALQV
ncbi:hypothetical protein [Paenibacillus donghaensis]|uniref:hypothetical protein n=1 Tax=Paenibacillus donghaensis TaxID=414771 RepID=UPI0012FC9554|nr:hypothetical protein [Paenibacillus donghaensis]